MNNKTKRILLKAGLAVFVILLLTLSALRLSNDVKTGLKKNPFDIVLADKDFYSIVIDHDTLWGGGANGLYKINMKTLETQEVGSYKFVRAILKTKDGLYIGHEDGLTCIGKKTVTYTVENGLPDNRVNALMEDNYGNIWAGTWGGAVKFDDKIFTVFTKKDGLLENMVNVITQDSNGGIWFGSYVAPRGGISILSAGKWTTFTTKDALLHANITSIISLRDKSVLTGGGLYTNGGGTFFRFVNHVAVKVGTLTKNDGIAGEKIRSLFEDSNGRLWVGSEYDGLCIISKNKKTILTEKDGLSSNEVKKIAEDENGNIWLGTRNGLTKIKKAIADQY
jgi:ligand-binding sensor domain-containing protein